MTPLTATELAEKVETLEDRAARAEARLDGLEQTRERASRWTPAAILVYLALHWMAQWLGVTLPTL